MEIELIYKQFVFVYVYIYIQIAKREIFYTESLKKYISID